MCQTDARKGYMKEVPFSMKGTWKGCNFQRKLYERGTFSVKGVSLSIPVQNFVEYPSGITEYSSLRPKDTKPTIPTSILLCGHPLNADANWFCPFGVSVLNLTVILSSYLDFIKAWPVSARYDRYAFPCEDSTSTHIFRSTVFSIHLLMVLAVKEDNLGDLVPLLFD